MSILAFHFIFSAYGFWLPNDPRGSWSDTIRALHQRRHGRATRVHTTRSLAHDTHDSRARLAAKRSLKYPPVRFTALQARAIAQGGAAQAAVEARRAVGRLMAKSVTRQD